MKKRDLLSAIECLFKEMKDKKTNKAIDSLNRVWILKEWDGEGAHFRTAVGTKNELILDEVEIERGLPFRAHDTN